MFCGLVLVVYYLFYECLSQLHMFSTIDVQNKKNASRLKQMKENI